VGWGTVPVCDYFTCGNGCFGILGNSHWYGDGAEPSYPNRGYAIFRKALIAQEAPSLFGLNGILGSLIAATDFESRFTQTAVICAKVFFLWLPREYEARDKNGE